MGQKTEVNEWSNLVFFWQIPIGEKFRLWASEHEKAKPDACGRNAIRIKDRTRVKIEDNQGVIVGN